MDAPIKVGRRITTGLFEIDLSTGEVLRQGRRLPVQEQPFRVLALLLEHPGQVISREKLQASLWPADTYVSFDEGLNTAIRKLRVLFGDSADNPRFKKVYDSMAAFRGDSYLWWQVAEMSFDTFQVRMRART